MNPSTDIVAEYSSLLLGLPSARGVSILSAPTAERTETPRKDV